MAVEPAPLNQPLPDQALRDRGALVMAHIARVLGVGVQGYRTNEDDHFHEEVQLADGLWHRVSDLLTNAGEKP